MLSKALGHVKKTLVRSLKKEFEVAYEATTSVEKYEFTPKVRLSSGNL